MPKAREILKAARKETGLAVRAFAEEAGFSAASSYQHYEDGYKGESLPIEVLLKVVPVLKRHRVSNRRIRQLTRGVPIPFDNVTYVSAPLISWVAAGQPRDVWEDAMATATEHYPIPHHRETVACLKVRGNSMSRIAPEGTIIAVDYEDTDAIDGKLYIARVGDTEVTFKRYRAKPDRLEPESLMNGHDAIFGDFTLLGRVIYILRAV